MFQEKNLNEIFRCKKVLDNTIKDKKYMTNRGSP